ncbi:hypothetical protein BCL90_1812 [Pedobacter alluvionis]|uniref:Uncharacterized protein n=1 Tax=Pedobacter alluvionis TaxID=475253 RepID=A0A497Y8U4_9SPHI|nr:hypothetical protein BCL90_1812 [Pedobacter alluvionis]
MFLLQRYIKKVEGVKVEGRRLSNAPKNMALITRDQENRHAEFSSASFLLLRPEMNPIASRIR